MVWYPYKKTLSPDMGDNKQCDQNACWLVIVMYRVYTAYIVSIVLYSLVYWMFMFFMNWNELTQYDIPDKSTNLKAEWHEVFCIQNHLISWPMSWHRMKNWWLLSVFVVFSFGYGSMPPKVLNSWLNGQKHIHGLLDTCHIMSSNSANLS